MGFMQADAKAALVDSSSRTNVLNLFAMGTFFALVFWRPLFAWTFLGCAYLGLGARSVIRLRRLHLPTQAAKLLQIGNITASQELPFAQLSSHREICRDAQEFALTVVAPLVSRPEFDGQKGTLSIPPASIRHRSFARPAAGNDDGFVEGSPIFLLADRIHRPKFRQQVVDQRTQPRPRRAMRE